MRSRRKHLSVVLAVTASLAVTPATADSTEDGPNAYRLLTDEAALAEHLVARGIDPATAVVQRGERNYAGPSCPGAGWTCVTATGAVVQLSGVAAGGTSAFECSGASTGPNDCTVVQIGDGGANVATCTLGTPASPVTTDPVEQDCSIEQINIGVGTNMATVTQAVLQRRLQGKTITQDAGQTTSVAQTSEDGGNGATVLQRIEQIAETKNSAGPITHTQEARQVVDLDQASVAGDQSADVDQVLIQDSLAKFNKNGLIMLLQEDADDGPDSEAFFAQHSAGGVNTATLDQSMTLDQEATSNKDSGLLLRQGSPSGGLEGEFDGDSGHSPPPPSRFTSRQQKHFNQLGVTTASASLDQEDLELCCIVGDSATYDECEIRQDATLEQQPAGNQTVYQRGRAEVRDNCTLEQTSETNAGAQSRTASGTFFDVTTNRCTEGCPDSRLEKTVRNDTAGGSFASTADAEPSDVIEFRLVYDNEGNADANGVTVADAVPDHSSFLSCSDGCTGAAAGDGAGTPFEWALGTIAAGGTRTVTFRVELDDAFPLGDTTIENIASVASDVEEPHDSTRVIVTVTAFPDSSLEKEARNVTEEGGFGPGADAGAGDTIQYRLTVRNDGSAAATAVTVADAVPDRSSFVSCTDGCTGAVAGDGPGTPVEWSLGSIEAGDERAVRFTVELDPVFPNGETDVDNIAGGDSEEEEPFGSLVVTVTVTAAPESDLAKAVRNVTLGGSFDDGTPDEADAVNGNRIAYRLRYTNEGTADATGVSVFDEIPEHSTWQACSPSCTRTGDGPGSTVTWNLGTIDPGETVDLVLTVDLDLLGYEQFPTLIDNVAHADSDEEDPAVPSNPARVTVTCGGVLC